MNQVDLGDIAEASNVATAIGDDRPQKQTRARGIFIDAEGCKTVDKQYKGQRIYARLGRIPQDDAEAWLGRQLDTVRKVKLFGDRPERTFPRSKDPLLDRNAETVDRRGCAAYQAARPIHRRSVAAPSS